MEPVKMDEETYMAINGASILAIGDSALHKNKGNNSDKTWKKIVNAQAAKDLLLIKKREKLRQEYADKVAAGEIAPLTRIEKLKQIASGMDENESVQAARRILIKMNITWI